MEGRTRPVMEATEVCPLCQTSGSPFHYSPKMNKHYYLCANCSGIYLSPHDHPHLEEEKKRYELHTNVYEDLGYRNFLSPVLQKVQSHYSQGRGLDYGAGKGKVLARMLKECGFSMEVYDPFYYPQTDVLKTQSYNFVVCTETMEHFHKPQKEFALLRSLLLPGGRLFCQTEFYFPELDFESWYYKNDPTHVFFYQTSTLDWIRQEFGFSTLVVEKRIAVFS